MVAKGRKQSVLPVTSIGPFEEYAFMGLSCMAEITTIVTEKEVAKTSTQYLIGSVKTLEEVFISRSKHWSIESMHWILDMAFEEDRSRNIVNEGEIFKIGNDEIEFQF